MQEPTSPRASVVIPVRDRPRELARALASVLAQTEPRWECLVVDDGSAGPTLAVAREHAARDCRVRLVELARPAGPNAARNAGIREARAPWVAFLDSDDELARRSLEARLRAARAFHARHDRWPGVVYGWHEEAGARGQRELLRPCHEGNARGALRREFFGVTSTLLVRGALLARVGGFDESLRGCDEYDLLMRLAPLAPFAVAREVVATRHAPAGGRRAGNPAAFAAFLDRWAEDLRAHGGPRLLATKRRLCGSMFAARGERLAAARQHALALWEAPLSPGTVARLCALALPRRAP